MRRLIPFLCIITALTLGTPASSQDNQEFTGFYLEFYDTEIEDVATVLELISDDQELLYEVVDDLNEFLVIPVAVPIIFADCGTSNAFYSPEDMTVVICHEMILSTFHLFLSYP